MTNPCPLTVRCPDGSDPSDPSLPVLNYSEGDPDVQHFCSPGSGTKLPRVGDYSAATTGPSFTCITDLAPLNCCSGKPYSGQMSVVTTLPSVTFSASGLPSGLHLSQVGPKTAIVSGIAPAKGTYTITISATAGTAVYQRTYKLTVGGLTTASAGIS